MGPFLNGSYLRRVLSSPMAQHNVCNVRKRQRCAKICSQTPFSTQMYWNDIYLPECHGEETHYPALTTITTGRDFLYLYYYYFLFPSYAVKSRVWTRRGRTGTKPGCVMGSASAVPFLYEKNSQNVALFSGRDHGKGELRTGNSRKMLN